ncbi:MAG TPA: substrate-binding domain-containing protein [Bryobacteraceae bacterium]|nr:substrate-binding domain-containing protein [Bryobacteraceae bacterium]
MFESTQFPNLGADNGKYLVGPILRACKLLQVFRSEDESLSLRELVVRTGLNKTTAFRAAQSLVAGGLLERVAGDQYRCLMAPIRERGIRIGYGAMAANSLFSRAVSEGIRLAAESRGIELIELDNQCSARTAIRNSERLVRERVALAIEFQVHHEVAPLVASKFSEAGIPLVAIHTPHPGATFFGGNNYLAGRIAGRALGRWAMGAWGGKADAVMLIGHASAGPLTQSRLTGTAAGISEVLPLGAPATVVNIDAKGGYVESLEAVLKFLRRASAKRILVGCINDATALGALRAFEESARPEDCAVAGQNATIAARAALRQPRSRLIGSVAYFPETYGAHLVPLAMDILRGKPVPTALFVKHTLITAQNVDHYYPNDSLSVVPDMDSLLLGRYQ